MYVDRIAQMTWYGKNLVQMKIMLKSQTSGYAYFGIM